MQTETDRPIVLASSSPYRRQILARAGLRFTVHSPNLDETPKPGESAAELVLRLARAKAKAVAARCPAALIIGADQVVAHADAILGKPADHAAAVAQLQRMSGATVVLHCGVALYDAAADDMQSAVEPVTVTLRELDSATIQRYLKAEQPYQCCGSLKAEGPGIALLARITAPDPNAVTGLPMIRLVDMLKNAGVELV